MTKYFARIVIPSTDSWWTTEILQAKVDQLLDPQQMLVWFREETVAKGTETFPFRTRSQCECPVAVYLRCWLAGMPRVMVLVGEDVTYAKMQLTNKSSIRVELPEHVIKFINNVDEYRSDYYGPKNIPVLEVIAALDKALVTMEGEADAHTVAKGDGS